MELSSDFTKPGSHEHELGPEPPATPDAAAVGPPLIGALLRIPLEAVRGRMLAGLHDAGFTDLVAAHLDVFQYPGPENMRPSELATRTRMSKQALNYLLGQLEHLGYLTRETDSSDQRSKRIRLAPRGRAVLTTIREIVHEVEAGWEQQLGPRRFAQLRRLLEELLPIAAATDHSPERQPAPTT
jgi:DNA-binding MarR family transcriptional regulator